MGVKVADGQGFHVGEQFCSEVPHGALTYIDHDAVVTVSAQDSDGIYNGQRDQCRGQTGEIRRLSLSERNDIFIDQSLHEECTA